MAHTVSLVAPRRQTRPVQVGSVQVGGDAPISVQSMTNTDTRDLPATLAQIHAIAQAGADLVRVSCPDMASAEAVKALVAQAPVPLIADIHFDHRLALKALACGIHCLRINPGNIGSTARVQEVVAAARERCVPIRIGVNAGSLEKQLLEKYGEPCAEAMVESALHHIHILEDLNYPEIKVSLKASDVGMTVMAYRQLASKVNYPLHLGITEAGGMRSGSVKSAIGLGLLLAEGIGDTLRVSLSADPVEEIKVGFDILKSLGLRSLGVNIIACPTCARQEFKVIDVVAELERRLAHIREPVTLSIIGCVVNGPGEAKETMVGVVGGQGENLLYQHGQTIGKRGDAELVETVVEQVEAIAQQMRAAKEKAEAE
ncbi:4-hydroxy-3-methylbut-2-en-1-yl diphosphate synthase [Magnetococcus marinus MC-1]|uniref:4-hydroxy-3-methylbut-2-en-1-yl diphosphate synthase (flavodoxin) n=1 Tax=Magnetococcus marinus (strain ATCC BAA-1437 / JCM 17883 / MC-1) TaxID=156889 RepID=ISPG_MAGMM|nr:flavodoxin-dependent (E)-4-hydroxy-3-methylbut-2-enyl-diphosphate synthase [Magnetococcus marinus]A0LDN3.1 RecName: Full=4-hydroxy-3-methylbut-2-en-1-yl diphosphate synthase (flavodoxin); AltName: Full=1-hydroxy-2-methyl-2-(E)-butenyl 4-diphosphate synthase [Magnetococcus marinus MC-1]ABK46076.1 4-hydroxy-3-methylbut-2-en-1-yl diphosphate synthase [Magnetococcus marinus MC-1]